MNAKCFFSCWYLFLLLLLLCQKPYKNENFLNKPIFSGLTKILFKLVFFVQNQPPEVFCKKSCSEEFCNIYRKVPMLESLFNKVAGLCNFIKKRLQHKSSPVSIAKFLRIPILKNSKRLLLFAINWSKGWSENVVSIRHICLVRLTSKNMW